MKRATPTEILSCLDKTITTSGINKQTFIKARKLVKDALPYVVERYKKGQYTLNFAYAISRLSKQDQAKLEPYNWMTIKGILQGLKLIPDTIREKKINKQLEKLNHE